MTTMTEQRTPEETALQLDLILLGTLTSRDFPAGPIAANPILDVKLLREIRRLAERLQNLSTQGEDGIGVMGAVPASRRALISTWIASSVAVKKPVTLVDADLRFAHLSFDEGTYAQEGLVDVLRYGVRSPRVVAPTLVPGVSLLPVGTGTIDLAGTWASDAFEPLLRELSRSGDFLVINGPAIEDLEEAGPFLDRISCWMLVHEMGTTDPEDTRRIRDRIGADKIIGVLVLHPDAAVSEPVSVPENVHEVLKTKSAEQSEGAEPAAPARRGAKRTGLFAAAGAAAVAAALLIPRLFSTQSSETASTPPEEPWTAEEPAASAVPPADDSPSGVVDPMGHSPILTPSEGGTPATDPATQSSPSTGPPSGEAGTQAPPTMRSDLGAGGLPMATPISPARPPVTNPTAGSPMAKTEPSRPAPSEPSRSSPTRSTEVSTPAPAKPAPSESSKPPTSSRTYGVHVCSMQTEAKARAEAARFEAAGYPTIVRQVDLGQKGIWHRVYAGPYENRAAAERASQEIIARGLTDFTLVQRISGKSSASGS
jgi:cell division septation protein DedD